MKTKQPKSNKDYFAGGSQTVFLNARSVHSNAILYQAPQKLSLSSRKTSVVNFLYVKDALLFFDQNFLCGQSFINGVFF